MPNLPIKTGAGDDAWIKASGAGTESDPFVPEHTTPLSSGAATEARQVVANDTLNDLRVNLGALADAPAASGNGSLVALLKAIRDRLFGTLEIDGTVAVANTVDVSGTVNVGNLPTTQAISADALPLPNNAATETSLAAMSAKLPAALESGRLPVSLPAGASALTDSELRASAVPTMAGDMSFARAIDAWRRTPMYDRTQGALRVVFPISQSVGVTSGSIVVTGFGSGAAVYPAQHVARAQINTAYAAFNARVFK